jgi:4-aminobutyrate aminotransferase/(S)-3-amino-2-methylpropionate transaminase
MSTLPAIRVAPPGPRSRELAARLAAVESPAFDARRGDRARTSGADQTPIVYAEGQGANVVDVDGNRYVDLTAGFGALVLGHVPTVVTRAVAAQEQRLALALGDVYAAESKVLLCERLARLLPGADTRVILGMSGADAVTAALKSAVLATGRPGVVAFEGGYHGLSHGPLAACGLHPTFRDPFAGQLNAHVTFAPYPSDAASLARSLVVVERALASGDVGAVLVEPILGRGGCVVPPASMLPALRDACTRAGALLVCDEIWTGMGRSGAMIASVAAGAAPDLVCLGKGLGAGTPISACVGTGTAMAAWGSHGGTTLHTATHFGSPVACAAALATLDALDAGALVDRARDAGGRWLLRLRGAIDGAGVREVRGRGLMVGVVLEGGAARALAVARRLLGEGWIVLTGGKAGDVLTLTPPLDIEEGLLDRFAEVLPAVCREARAL